jgi:hypothetical protein
MFNDYNPVADWVCCDCLHLAANGELPENATTPDGELTDRGRELTASLANLIGSHLGADHSSCGHDRDHDTDIYCETDEFSSRPCDSCGERLAGSRHAMILATE